MTPIWHWCLMKVCKMFKAFILHSTYFLTLNISTWYIIENFWHFPDITKKSFIFLTFSWLFGKISQIPDIPDEVASLPLTAQKISFKKTIETPEDIIILHKCTKNHDHMLYCFWDMARDGCNCYFSVFQFQFFSFFQKIKTF